MNTGRSLNDLAAELSRQATSRRDFIAPQGKVDAVVLDGDVVLDGFNGGNYPITNHAHGQLADVLDIPKKYYDRMRAEEPGLLATNINGWLKREPEAKRMLRTLDGKVRAVLSPKFRPLDNFDLANAVLPALLDRKDDNGNSAPAEIVSSELTETRMYIKAVFRDLSDDLPAGLSYGGHNRIGTDRGHLVSAIVISNSDVGAGTLRVEPSVFTTSCTNLAIRQAAAMKKYHVGRAHSADESWEVFRDETRLADDRAFWLKVQDVTRAAFKRELFMEAVIQIRKAAGQPITSNNLQAVVDATVEQLALPPATAAGILGYLAKGGDFSQWGLSSAITRVAGEVKDYQQATDLERAGGAILELPAARWEAIAAVA